MPVFRRTTGVLLALVLLTASAAAAKPRAQAFVVRKGSRLYLAGKPFRFGGANIEWLGLLGYGPADPLGPRYPSHYEINDALTTAKQLGATVVRSQTMGDSVGCDTCIEPEPGKFNEAAFEPIDYALAAARAHGIRLIPTIVGDDARGGGTGCVYLRWRGIDVPNCSLINMAPFWTTPTVIADVEQHIDAVLNHVNIYTHVAYKDDPTILGWDLLNGGGSPTPWTRQIAAHVRDVDGKHLILSAANNAALNTVDTCVAFVYPHWSQTLESRRGELDACANADKPFIAYEYGWDVTNYPTRSGLRAFLQTLAANPQIAGDAFWALQAHADGHGWLPLPADTTDPVTARTGESGQWWALYYPGLQTLVNAAADMTARAEIIRAHNFRMDGVRVPRHAIPPAPSITSAAAGHVYWQGSAGAQNYSVQRAATRKGPWATICRRCATDLDDGYVDAGASASNPWYRVIAYNLDGKASRPSPAASEG